MPSQQCGSLAYDLLLEKSYEAKLPPNADEGITAAAVATVDEVVSTVAPSSDRSTAGSDTSPLRRPAAAFNKSDVVLISDVVVHGPAVDAELEDLLQQASELSEGTFNEDFKAEVTKKSGWKLSLLVSKDQSIFFGFAVAKMTKGILSVAKIAVAVEFRGCGLGRHIMNELMKAAKKQGNVYEVCLSSLPGAIAFYKRLGFRTYEGLRATAQEDVVEGQVYMEKRLRQRPRHRR
mmetsp:Transcript_68399/g.132076  ORF Transcript_68399/g.132076 Transcript_68399/m.132076 type:complete len:234 (+) Transcript_68399:76-777(+)